MTVTRCTENETMALSSSPVQVVTSPRFLCPEPVRLPQLVAAPSAAAGLPMLVNPARCQWVPAVSAVQQPPTFPSQVRTVSPGVVAPRTSTGMSMVMPTQYVLVNMIPVHQPHPFAIRSPSLRLSPCSTPTQSTVVYSPSPAAYGPEDDAKSEQEDGQDESEINMDTKPFSECYDESADGSDEGFTKPWRRSSDPSPIQGARATAPSPTFRRMRGSSVSSLASSPRRATTTRTKRGPYQHFSFQQRLEIADYAAVHGSTAAARHFTTLYSRPVKRSTIDSMLAKLRQSRRSESAMDHYC